MDKIKLKQNESIKMKIILPVLIVFACIIIVFLSGAITIRNMANKENIKQRVQGVEQLFQEYLSMEALFLTARIDTLKENQAFYPPFLLKDRTALFKQAKPVFDDLLARYKITHFYFTDLSRINFLRVHNPEKHGDKINKFTTLKAQKEKTTTFGIELGQFGTFTLRVVHPWIIEGKHEGYIELGMEIGHITPKIKKVIGSELIFTIKKSELDQDKWEQGLNMMGKKGDWNQFSDCVVIDQTLDDLPFELKKHLDLVHEKYSGALSTITTTDNNKKYYFGFIPLTDVSNKVVGDIVVLLDVTQLHAKTLRLWAGLFIISLFLFVGLSLFFIHYIGRRMVELQDAVAEKEKFQGVLEMAGAVCHEINQPLMSISGYSEILLMDVSEDNPQYEPLREINEQAHRLGKITNKLMSMTTYKTKIYLKRNIIDIDESSPKEGINHETTERKKNGSE